MERIENQHSMTHMLALLLFWYAIKWQECMTMNSQQDSKILRTLWKTLKCPKVFSYFPKCPEILVTCLNPLGGTLCDQLYELFEQEYGWFILRSFCLELEQRHLWNITSKTLVFQSFCPDIMTIWPALAQWHLVFDF